MPGMHEMPVMRPAMRGIWNIYNDRNALIVWNA